MNTIDSQNQSGKVFMIQRSELEERLEPKFYTDKYLNNERRLFTSKYPIHSLIEVTELISDGTHFTPKYTSSGIKFISVKDVRSFEISFSDTRYISESEAEILDKRCKPIYGDVLLTKIGTYGLAAIVETSERFQIFVSLALIRPNKKVTSKYLELFLNSSLAFIQFQRVIKGAGVPDLHLEDIRKLKLPIPPIITQQAIVQFFNDTYHLKQQKESSARSLLAGIDNYLLQQLGITLPEKKNHLSSKTFIVNFNQLTGVRFDPKPFEKYYTDLQIAISNSGYKLNKLKNIITHLSSGDWGIDDSPVYSDDFERCLVIRSTEFDNEYNLMLDSKRVKYRLINREKLLKLDLQRNDILIEKSGGSPDQPVGRVAILDSSLGTLNKFCFSNFIHKIRCDQSKVDAEYLYFLLRSFHTIGLTETLQSQTNGIRNLMMKSYLDLTIPIPPLEKQSEIVAHINSVRQKAHQLQSEAAAILGNAKQEIEKMILG